MLHEIRNIVRREMFITTPLSLFINPSYIIRRGLYKTLKSIAPEISGKVLDFGCGSKPYEELFCLAISYTGIDIEISGHDHKHSKVDKFYDGITIPFSNDYFDTIVSFEVFEHLFNIDDLAMELNRVLRPGGRIVISIPFAWGEHEQPFDFARYTSFGIKHILERNGFRVDSQYKTTGSFLAISQTFISYIFESFCPRSTILSFIFRIFFVFPMNVMAILLNFVFPKADNYFSGLVVVGSKT